MKENQIIEWNAGKLPDQFTIDTLHQKHPSIPYNPLIASTFFWAGYIETWGRGIEKMINECKITNPPIPQFTNQFGGLMITFDAGNIDHLEEAPKKIRKKTSEKTLDRIMELIEKNSNITILQLAEIIGNSARTVERNIKKLQKENKLKRIGADKSGYWEILENNN